MNHNQFHRFDPHQFKKCLSSFGQSVLDVMIRQREKEQEEHRSFGRGESHLNYDASGFARTAPRYERTSNAPAARARNRRILKFIDSNVTPNISYNPMLLTTLTRKIDDVACDFDQMPLLNSDNIGQTDELPTSINLVKTIDTITTEIELNNYSKEDLYKTNRDKVEGKHTVYDLYNEGSDEGDEMDLNVSTQLDILKAREPKIVDTGKDVNWDNMFDTEIFRELESNVNKNDEFIKTAQDKFNVPCENTQGTPEFEQSKQIQILSDEIVVEGKPSKSSKKRKHQTKITDTAPKKIKKVTSENIIKPNGMSFRKQTNTKTVNNWLKNVDPNNSVDEEHTFDTLKPTLNIVSENTVIIDEICLTMEDSLRKPNVDTTNEKVADESKPKKLTKACKAKPAKKVVQSQLANKDGVMKFKKPKSKSITENNEKTDATESTKMQKENNKKMKPKFVAPIKSQVPVKDIMFEVVNIDGKNYTEYLNNIANSSEIILILLYSNGFCQLNSQHTDDTLSAEGVMVNVDETCYYMKHADFPNSPLKDFLSKILSSKKIISYEAKNLLIYLATRFGLEVDKHNFNIIDAKIGGSLIDPDNPPENFSDLQKVLSFAPDYTVATECALQKAAWYISLLKDCADRLQAVLRDHSLWNMFDELEMQLLPIIADMERRGVTVDLKKLKAMESLLQEKIKSVEQECYKAAGKTFQINSPLQVRTILYDELKLDSKTNVKIRETITTGAKSTSETMLRSLMAVHPLPKLILEYRHLHKAQATFLTGIAQHVMDGVVKPTWVQTAAATGRIASNNPNLQAIPKAPFSLVMFPDPGHTESQLLNFRSVYIARPGYVLLAADFQHVECRVFAHAAADTSLLEILKGSGDLFRVLAAKWLNKQEDQVSSEDRERTKRIVYASLYGAGTRKLMDILDVSYEQTLSITASFNRTFPSLKSFGREVVSRCAIAGGRLSTLGGRARHFKHITSCDFALKSHAERQAVNFVVQGSAADLCKTAMVLSERRLRACCPRVECRLVLQIHDELVWEVWETHLERAAAIIRQVMEGCGQQCGMSMKLPVAMAHGLNWGEMVHLPANVESINLN